MAKTNNTICVSSYNSRGFSEEKQDFIKTLQIFSDIVVLQEHMILTAKSKSHSNTNKIVKSLGQNCDMYITPAIKENNRVHGGRGKGGLATIWRKELTKYPHDNLQVD